MISKVIYSVMNMLMTIIVYFYCIQFVFLLSRIFKATYYDWWKCVQPWLYILLFIKKGCSFIDNFQGCLYLLGHMFMLHNLPLMCSSSPTNFHTIHDGDVLLYFIMGPYLDLLFLLETFKCISIPWGTFLSFSN